MSRFSFTRKNRKLQAHVIVLPPVACLAAAAGVLCIAYLWICGRCQDLGQVIRQLEKRRVEARRQVLNEEYKWANLTSPAGVESLIRRFNLHMIWPAEANIVRIYAQDADGLPDPAAVRSQVALRSRPAGERLHE